MEQDSWHLVIFVMLLSGSLHSFFSCLKHTHSLTVAYENHPLIQQHPKVAASHSFTQQDLLLNKFQNLTQTAILDPPDLYTFQKKHRILYWSRLTSTDTSSRPYSKMLQLKLTFLTLTKSSHLDCIRYHWFDDIQFIIII